VGHDGACFTRAKFWSYNFGGLGFSSSGGGSYNSGSSHGGSGRIDDEYRDGRECCSGCSRLRRCIECKVSVCLISRFIVFKK